MKPAVAYMRFSSHGQRETSIEGQRMVITEFAKREGYTITKEYIDRALTGTNDQRPEFQKMIRDSAKRQFETVLVYQLDRFARNRYDSADNKRKLKLNGVKVVSARETISDDASGILMEAMLEGMAEYYSVELSQKIKRGISLKIAECKHIGGYVPIGYALTEDKKYIIDPQTAPLVEKCFNLYAAGNTLKFINQSITEGYGKPFFGNSCNSLNRILSNKNYIGYYTRADSEVKDGVPRIISDELFERVQFMRNKNKKTPAKARAHEEYLLTTKLFCGHCKERIQEDVFMVGVSGTSKIGKIHNYYTCKNKWNKRDSNRCDKNNVKKVEIEDFILSYAQKQLTDENIEFIAKTVGDISKQENNTPVLAELKRQLRKIYLRQLRAVCIWTSCLSGLRRKSKSVKSLRVPLHERSGQKQSLRKAKSSFYYHS